MNIDDELFEKLQEIRDVVGWVCQSCRKDAVVKLQKLQSAHASLAEELGKLKVEMESLKKSFQWDAMSPLSHVIRGGSPTTGSEE